MQTLYALLCGMLVYVALLAAFGRRMPPTRWILVLGSLALALAFAIFALDVAGLVKHRQLIVLARAGFAGFGLSLAFVIGQYWLDSWRNRVR
jgi:hypothetical protein